MGDAEQPALLPPREDLETTEEFDKARKEYQTRVNRELDDLGPAYVRVTYTRSDEDPPLYDELQAHHKEARQQHVGEAHGLILIGHQDQGSTMWLGLSLLTSFREMPRASNLRGFLNQWHLEQSRTRKQPPRQWEGIRREANAVGRLPILVHAIHGTRSGTVLAPLSWYCETVPERRTP